jgi:Cdc6-like AAA superfamily ATPase
VGPSDITDPILSHPSSNSLSLLPPEPKIFHGRQSELSAIIQYFSHEVPRIAILGAGGMGKTSLARAVLHHPELTSRYEEHRFFVACDTVSTSIQLAGLIGAHIGLKSGRDLTGPVIRHFSSGPPTLLILDNLETVWEPTESRADIEKFLCQITDSTHLAFIVSTEIMHLPAQLTIRLDHNARSRKACQCTMDSPLS